ncbi:MAG: transposase [Puniceicoccales bacterium]|nr:transposase [Puniceicoccales bacterium]
MQRHFRCAKRNHKIFENMANWAHSSVSTTFGLKLHLVLNAPQKFVKFSLKPGNLHDVSRAEGVLAGCTGTVIGDSGYVSATLRDSLAKKGYTAHC